MSSPDVHMLEDSPEDATRHISVAQALRLGSIVHMLEDSPEDATKTSPIMLLNQLLTYRISLKPADFPLLKYQQAFKDPR